MILLHLTVHLLFCWHLKFTGWLLLDFLPFPHKCLSHALFFATYLCHQQHCVNCQYFQKVKNHVQVMQSKISFFFFDLSLSNIFEIVSESANPFTSIFIYQVTCTFFFMCAFKCCTRSEKPFHPFLQVLMLHKNFPLRSAFNTVCGFSFYSKDNVIGTNFLSALRF